MRDFGSFTRGLWRAMFSDVRAMRSGRWQDESHQRKLDWGEAGAFAQDPSLWGLFYLAASLPSARKVI